MTTPSRLHTPLVAAVLLVGAVAACDRSPARGAFPAGEDIFAQQYIRALHDSGPQSVLGRTRREAVAVPAFVYGLQGMGMMLPMGPIDSVRLERHEPVAADSTRRAGTRLVYRVHGQPQAAQVTMLVVPEEGRLVVDEISVARREGT